MGTIGYRAHTRVNEDGQMVLSVGLTIDGKENTPNDVTSSLAESRDFAAVVLARQGDKGAAVAAELLRSLGWTVEPPAAKQPTAAPTRPVARTAEQRDASYLAGCESAWVTLLEEACRVLGFENDDEPRARVAALLSERTQAKGKLRLLFDDLGIEWTEDLHLVDLLSALEDHLEDERMEAREERP